MQYDVQVRKLTLVFFNRWHDNKLLKQYQHTIKWKRRSVDAPSRAMPSLSVFLRTKSPSTVIFLLCSRYNYSLWLTDTQTQFNWPMTSHHDMTSHRIRSNVPHIKIEIVSRLTRLKLWKITFFNLVTLTFDLWPWPSNSSEMLSSSTAPLNFRSVPQTVQPVER